MMDKTLIQNFNSSAIHQPLRPEPTFQSALSVHPKHSVLSHLSCSKHRTILYQNLQRLLAYFLMREIHGMQRQSTFPPAATSCTLLAVFPFSSFALLPTDRTAGKKCETFQKKLQLLSKSSMLPVFFANRDAAYHVLNFITATSVCPL